jgi:hypothetical protein
MNKNQIDSFYISCMNCPNTEVQCKGILKDIPGGIPPRGFLYMAAPIKILVVSKNPGHPLPGEQAKYVGKSGESLFLAYRNHQNDVYYHLHEIKDRSVIFHKNLFSYLSYFLDIENDVDTIYQYAAHTNLVKCSTVGEQDKLARSTMEECYQKYFIEELKLLQPKVLLALGHEVEKFLIKKKSQHGLPVVYIKHPSYHYSKENKDRILAEKKEEILAYSS